MARHPNTPTIAQRLTAIQKQGIIDELNKTSKIEGVVVNVSPTGSTVNVNHGRHHVPNIKFKWNRDHFSGFIQDANGDKGMAILSIWNENEVKTFQKMYKMMISLSARRRLED